MKNKCIFLGMLAVSSLGLSQEKTKGKDREISEVTITKTKKAIEQKSDRTIFDFSEQPNLNTGSVMEGMKKLPGLIVSDMAGMLYQGKPLEVYMDGRPMNISSNQLNGFLEGMPANSVERIEIITQPGAEFPATSGGAIMNIITSKTAKNYLTATYSGNYSFTNYDKYRSRTNNSLLLNARNKWLGWQLNVGQNYRESMMNSSFDDLTKTYADRTNRGYFTKAAMTFELGKDRLLLNYDIFHNNNHSFTGSTETNNGLQSLRDDLSHTLNLRQEAVATYQKKFDNPAQKLDFKFTYGTSKSDFEQNNLFYSISGKDIPRLENTSGQDSYNFKIDYAQPIKILDEGKISIGGLYERLNFDTHAFGIKNLEYKRQTASSYLELQAKYKKFDFVVGARAEDYDINGKSWLISKTDITEKDLTPFKQFRIFPNASVQYNFMKQVYLSLNYNKKINLPSISALNPNNNTYQNSNISITGNPNLLPTIFDNYEIKISAFDYAFIGYNLSVANNQTMQIVKRDGNKIINEQQNIPQMKIHNFNVGIPLPFMLFTKGLKETMKFNFNPDKINFMYLYAGYQLHQLPDVQSKGFWIANLMTQVILPKDVKLVANYSYITPNGNYFYFMAQKAFNHSFDLNLSKKFMTDRLTISVFANDIFNTNKMAFQSIAQANGPIMTNKFDTRTFGLSVNYKIPTKNKLAKENPNLLNKDKKEEGGLMNNQ